MSGVDTAINTAITGLQAELIAVAAIGLGIGAVLLAFRAGWRVARSFIR